MIQVQAARAAFRELHHAGCFVIPNPWDVGTARFLEHLGYAALATTSAGFAFSAGLPDTDWAVPLDTMLAHIGQIVTATSLPVNADFESGYARDLDGLATNVKRCVEAGVAGLSIEDATGVPDAPLFPIETAVARIRAARQAIDDAGGGVLLTGRAECFLVRHPDPLEESVRRLTAYAEAGADVLYAPDVGGIENVRRIVRAVAPRPVNVLASAPSGLTVADLAAAGVRRVSVGSSLARAAWGGFLRAAREIKERGTFDAFAEATPYGELNGFFRGQRMPG